MIKNKSFTTLVVSLLLVGCNALPIKSLKSEPETTPIGGTSSEIQYPYTKEPSLSKSPSEELLALTHRKQYALDTFLNSTQSDDYWSLPLDLSRPDPYAKYNDDLYQVMRRGFTFDLTIEDKRISQQLRYYASHQNYINRVSDRASRYMFHIVAELQRRNLPMDLALLPIVESAFDPFAYSHGRASGMWQFIPSTGRMYGLKQNWWYDGRRDVVESTRAALDYLSQLNKMFDGDWLLALASYNSGPGTVLKAQRKNRAAGKPTDFWHLDLPKETEAYVPKMFALAKLFHAPDEYGIELPFVSTEPYFAIVETGGQIDLAQAAKLADMNLSDLYLLNPGFNRWATDPDGPHQLLVFEDKAEIFEKNIASLPADQRLTWKRYSIEPGDSLLTIARKFEVTVDVVKDVNNIRGNLIRAGDKLLIPVASQNDQYYALSADNRLKVKQNALSGSNKKRIDYKVQSGDTFWDISRKFNVSVQSLAKWNNMAPKDVLRPNQNLVIWVDPSSTAATTASIDDRKVVRKVGYVVRSGDSLYRIADKFNLRVTDIEKWNTLPKKYLQPGDRLTLYVDVTRIQ
jgi:membrane-bound lytic murein transglycosylase D